jgi:hypothetical protein
MHPLQDHNQKPILLLEWNPSRLGIKDPSSTNNFQPSEIKWHPDMVEKYRNSLNCSGGSICQIKRESGPTLHAAMFAWDNSTSVTAIEAFRHHPEDCLGSIGMKLIQRYPDKVFRVDDQELYFNHSAFRDQEGITVHSFKATWIEGKSQSYISGMSHTDEWREQRAQAAWSRFSPKHARVVQGAVRSIHNPDAAWIFFERSVLVALHFQ